MHYRIEDTSVQDVLVILKHLLQNLFNSACLIIATDHYALLRKHFFNISYRLWSIRFRIVKKSRGILIDTGICRWIIHKWHLSVVNWVNKYIIMLFSCKVFVINRVIAITMEFSLMNCFNDSTITIKSFQCEIIYMKLYGGTHQGPPYFSRWLNMSDRRQNGPLIMSIAQ